MLDCQLSQNDRLPRGRCPFRSSSRRIVKPLSANRVLVPRKVTERPEASQMGMAKIVGTARKVIVREASRLLSNGFAYQTMASGDCPYGDGLAAARIATALSRWLEGEQPALPDSEQFQGAVRNVQLAV
jgi:UDP-N-acetylglucosamine 2-epimerase